MESAFKHRETTGISDTVLLDDPNDTNAFNENLRKRFRADLIYTYIGPVLISVNPYKELPIYGADFVKQYFNVNFIEVPPHIFGITDNAYRNLREESRDQCILISGESGSGKTEASKKVLEYIAAASKSLRTVESTKDKLLQSNPLLESFGNAQTNRNDNSSRFGKYMDIEFDFRGVPIGGHILNYLLEKSRVVNQTSGERNFHIFYQLLAGSDEKQLAALKLGRNIGDYNYLKQGKVKSSTEHDSQQFRAVTSAMKTVGFTTEEMTQVFEILSGVLHIGNIGFKQDGVHAKITTLDIIKDAASMFECLPEKLSKAFVNRTIEAREDLVVTNLKYDQSLYARDALAKAVYDRLFTWLVKRINKSLLSEFEGKKTLLGILDIYGFEIFESNSFEQFCINFCNEKLQQLFIELTLKSEQEEYTREGIEWQEIEYFNNKIICDLIEEKHKGIISVMDEECSLPGDKSDFTFLEKMDNKLSSHKHYLSHLNASNTIRKSLTRDEFRLLHYAGEVTYKVHGFLDKNNDLLYRDLREAMISSKKAILKELFPESELSRKKLPETAATQFKASLNQLMVILGSKEPSYIRCIKPNDFKKSGVFDLEIVSHQVKYLGLMENLRVRRAGFAYRRPYETFLQRYKSLCPKTWPNWKGPAREGVDILMKHIGYNSTNYQLGKTKIFIRHAQTLFAIEDAFQLRKYELVSKIKAKWLGVKQRKAYLRMRHLCIIVQKFARRFLAKRAAKKRLWATTVIKGFVKGFINRNSTESDANAKFLHFVRYRFLLKLKDSLPKALLRHGQSWPIAPPCADVASKQLCLIHRRQLVRKYIKGLSAERKRQLELKYLAFELFKGKKVSYEESVKSPFINTRILPEQKARLVVFENNLKNSGETNLYTTTVVKYDRHGYKPRERILSLSNKALYLLDTKDMKMKHRVELSELPALATTNMGDKLLLIRFPIELKKLKGDLILETLNVIETVTRIIDANKQNKSLLKIEPPGEMYHYMLNGKQGVIEVVRGNSDIQGIVKKKGHLIVTASG